MGVVSDMGAMVRDTNLGKGAALVGLAVLAGTLYIAFSRYWAKYTAPGPTRQRQVGAPLARARARAQCAGPCAGTADASVALPRAQVSKNKLLVEELSQTLPEARQALIPAKIKVSRRAARPQRPTPLPRAPCNACSSRLAHAQAPPPTPPAGPSVQDQVHQR